MAEKFTRTLRGRAFRLTRLDECGVLPTSGDPDAMTVGYGFASVKISTDAEDPEVISQKNAWGENCVYFKTPPNIGGYTLELSLCGLSPSAVSLLTNASTYTDYGTDVSGVEFKSGPITSKFAFELWTGTGGGACEGGDTVYGYTLLPFVNGGYLGDFEVVSDSATQIKITGAYTLDGNQWGVGPYSVLMDDTQNPPAAAVLPNAIGTDTHILMNPTTVAPPADSDGFAPMP